MLLIILVLGVAYLSHLRAPTLSRSTLPNITDGLVKAQVERAETLKEADILIVGDSSALMGISPTILKDLTGKSVETLATFAYAGPRGMASLLDRVSSRGIRPQILVLVIHSSGMARKEDWSTWTDVVIKGPQPVLAETNPWRGAIGKLNDIVSPVVFLPLDGSYGSYYGSAKGFENFVRLHHGSAVDPRLRLKKKIDADWCCNFEMTDLFRQDLSILKKAVNKLSPGSVKLVVSPVPQFWESQKASDKRKQAISVLLAELNLPEASLLDTPPYLPNFDFVSSAHLHEKAIPIFTNLLAQQLNKESPAHP